MTTPAHDPLTCQCDNCRLDRADFELIVDVFLDKTSLLVDVIVEAVLAEKPHTLTPTEVVWFTAYCDQRFRYFHRHQSALAEVAGERRLENRPPRSV